MRQKRSVGRTSKESPYRSSRHSMDGASIRLALCKRLLGKSREFNMSVRPLSGLPARSGCRYSPIHKTIRSIRLHSSQSEAGSDYCRRRKFLTSLPCIARKCQTPSRIPCWRSRNYIGVQSAQSSASLTGSMSSLETRWLRAEKWITSPLIVAHEFRHHWQTVRGWKYDGKPSVIDNTWRSIGRYFAESRSERDAMLYCLAKYPDDFHRQAYEEMRKIVVDKF